MGNLFSNCLQPTNNNTGKSKKKAQEQKDAHPQPAKDRVNDIDKAILDVKARMRKIKTYTDKLDIQLQQQDQKIKDFLKTKSKDRALIALKHKKFIQKELDKAEGAKQMLQQTINNIESTQMDVEVFKALKQGDQIITDLQKQASLEDFEELYDRHKEQQSRMEMEQEMFGQVLNDDELQDELAKLDAEILEMDLPSVPTGIVEIKNQQQNQQEVPVQSQQQQAASKQRVALPS